nr:MAG TPA: hypothetical protein [Caudoviricetes sp.]
MLLFHYSCCLFFKVSISALSFSISSLSILTPSIANTPNISYSTFLTLTYSSPSLVNDSNCSGLLTSVLRVSLSVTMSSKPNSSKFYAIVPICF